MDRQNLHALEISAAAVQLCLADLLEKAEALLDNRFHDMWIAAATSMRTTLNETLASHRREIEG